MDIIQSFISRAAKAPKRIVFPEGGNERIVAAAVQARKLGIALPVLLGEPKAIAQAAASAKVSIEGIPTIDPRDNEYLGAYTKQYAATREMREAIAAKLVHKPLAFGGMMVKNGHADGMVGGIDSATATVIQAASLTVGYRKGFSTPSSFFIMVVPEFAGEKDKAFIFADCAVAVSPTAAQLAEIGVVSGLNAKALLGIEPAVAFLSYSTRGSGAGPDVDKVVEAVALARKLAPDLAIDGELQGDSALIERVARKKAPGSSVAGKANVLVFPDLDSGNICYKLVQYLANAKAIGPIMQGFARPVNDLSRGASVEDVVGVTAAAVLQTQLG
jgi:phosphate acetyltransferase